jgi:hypothetical protein
MLPLGIRILGGTIGRFALEASTSDKLFTDENDHPDHAW